MFSFRGCNSGICTRSFQVLYPCHEPLHNLQAFLLHVLFKIHQLSSVCRLLMAVFLPHHLHLPQHPLTDIFYPSIFDRLFALLWNIFSVRYQTCQRLLYWIPNYVKTTSQASSDLTKQHYWFSLSFSVKLSQVAASGSQAVCLCRHQTTWLQQSARFSLPGRNIWERGIQFQVWRDLVYPVHSACELCQDYLVWTALCSPCP